MRTACRHTTSPTTSLLLTVCSALLCSNCELCSLGSANFKTWVQDSAINLGAILNPPSVYEHAIYGCLRKHPSRGAQLLMRTVDCLTLSSSAPQCDAHNSDVGRGHPDRQEHAHGSQQSGPSGHGQTQALTSRPWGHYTAPVSSQNAFTQTMPYPYRQHPRRQQRSFRVQAPPRYSLWKHRFVCLGRIGQTMVPDASERISLLQAGLGKKKICMVVKT